MDPGTPENGGSVIIAQFTIAADAVGTYEGTVDWQPVRQTCGSCGEIPERAPGSWLE